MTGQGRLGEIGESVGNALLSQAGRLSSRYHEKRGLEADVLESDNAYLVVFDAPGATSTDLQVRYLDGRVLVRLDRFREFHEGFEMRFAGRGLSLDASVELPDDAVVDATAATATLTDSGTLEVELPKEAPVDRAAPAIDPGHGGADDDEGSDDRTDEGNGSADDGDGGDDGGGHEDDATGDHEGDDATADGNGDAVDASDDGDEE